MRFHGVVFRTERDNHCDLRFFAELQGVGSHIGN